MTIISSICVDISCGSFKKNDSICANFCFAVLLIVIPYFVFSLFFREEGLAMDNPERASKDVFLTSLFKMYYEQQCIANKRKRLVFWIRFFDISASCIPLIILFLIEWKQECLNLWLIILGISNILVVVSRMLPIHKRSEELLRRTAKIESLISEMELNWRMYQLSLMNLDSFTQKHELIFEEYGRGFDTMNEVYEWKAKLTTRSSKSAKEYMEEFLSYPEQVDDLFSKVADGGNEK